MPIGLADSAITGGGIGGLLLVDSGGAVWTGKSMNAPALRSGPVWRCMSVSSFTDVSAIDCLFAVLFRREIRRMGGAYQLLTGTCRNGRCDGGEGAMGLWQQAQCNCRELMMADFVRRAGPEL